MHVSYLIEESLWKLLETLGTHKALLMVQLSITIDYLLSRSKATLAALTGRVGQGICHAAAGGEKKQNKTHDVILQSDIHRGTMCHVSVSDPLHIFRLTKKPTLC